MSHHQTIALYRNCSIGCLVDRISWREFCNAPGPLRPPHHIPLLTGRPVAFRHGRPLPRLPLFSLAIPPLLPHWRNSLHAKTNWFFLPLVLWGHILIWLIGWHCSSAFGNVGYISTYFEEVGFGVLLGSRGEKSTESQTFLFLDVMWYTSDTLSIYLSICQ